MAWFICSFCNWLFLHKSRKVHVLGDALSIAPHIISQPGISNIQLINAHLPNNFEANYETENVFGPICKALKGEFTESESEKVRVQLFLPHFKLTNVKFILRGQAMYTAQKYQRQSSPCSW